MPHLSPCQMEENYVSFEFHQALLLLFPGERRFSMSNKPGVTLPDSFKGGASTSIMLTLPATRHHLERPHTSLPAFSKWLRLFMEPTSPLSKRPSQRRKTRPKAESKEMECYHAGRGILGALSSTVLHCA